MQHPDCGILVRHDWLRGGIRQELKVDPTVQQAPHEVQAERRSGEDAEVKNSYCPKKAVAIFCYCDNDVMRADIGQKIIYL